MASHFINSFTYSLRVPTSSPPLFSAALEVKEKGSNSEVEEQISQAKRALYAILASFPHSQLLNLNQIDNAVSVLSQLESQNSSITVSDTEELTLRNAVFAKLAVGLYAEALNLYLTQAIQVEAEADWWRDIERSGLNVAWYLLQSASSLRIYGSLIQHGFMFLS
jgi:nuclear-control-of-ATPase protein 2